MGVELGTLDVTALFAPERALLLELLRGLRGADWERATECPAWNVKGIALHILGDDLSLLTRQRDASTNSLILFAQDHPGLSLRELLDGFNEQWVTAAQFFSTDLVIELLRLVGEWSDDFYGTVGLDTTSGEPVGFFATDRPSPYWQVIAREYVERFVHQSQIRRALDAPELDRTFVAGAALVAVHALAAWLRHFEPPLGTTIAIDFGETGAWTWRRESDHWSAGDGAPSTPTVRFTVAPERSVALLSRGLSRAEALDSLAIDGDVTVARGALDIVAPMLGRPDA